MLNRIKDSFTASKAGKAMIPAIAAFGIATMPFEAHAENTNKCAPLYVSKTTGITRSASASAHYFSEENKGNKHVSNVGVSIVEGVDLAGYTPNQIGQYIVQQLEKDNPARKAKGLPEINAECFVDTFKSPNGTSIRYKVEGIDVPHTGTGLNIIVALNEDTLNTVKGEATLVKVAQVDNDMDHSFAAR